jgi:hypothetical protein
MQNSKIQFKIKKWLESAEVAYENFFGPAIRLSSFKNFISSPRLVFIRNYKLEISNFRQNGGAC